MGRFALFCSCSLSLFPFLLLLPCIRGGALHLLVWILTWVLGSYQHLCRILNFHIKFILYSYSSLTFTSTLILNSLILYSYSFTTFLLQITILQCPHPSFASMWQQLTAPPPLPNSAGSLLYPNTSTPHFCSCSFPGRRKAEQMHRAVLECFLL